MVYSISLKTFTDNRGNSAVSENVTPFDVKKIFYIYDDSGGGGLRQMNKELKSL